MKRSDLNRLQREALALFAQHSFALPPFATWDEAAWRSEPEAARYCILHQMGWDITDFGLGDFSRRGLVIFCSRNGQQVGADAMPYAEKLLVVREGQEVPFHRHLVKTYDIIVRGGGTLMLEFRNPDGDRLADTPVTVMTDGKRRVFKPGEPLRLRAGESVTIPRELWIRFWGEPGKGTVFVGEVSNANDDLTDNYFFDEVGRFVGIEEDEPRLYPLWNELEAVLRGS